MPLLTRPRSLSLTTLAALALTACGPHRTADPASPAHVSHGAGAWPSSSDGSNPGSTQPENAGSPAPSGDATSSADASSGFDAMLTDYAYPYPVAFFTVKDGEETHSMAYMDLAPTKPNGRTVVLLHGKNFSGAYWQTTADALAQKGFRVVMPDQLGFGKSDKPLGYAYSFHALARNTAGLLASLGVERYAVVGHSMGGMLATRLALSAPARVASLTLVNPIGLEDWQRKVPYVPVDAWTERNLKATPEGIRQYMEKSYFDGAWKPAYDPLVEIQAGWAVGPDSAHIARVSALHYDMIFTQPVVHEFPDIDVPTLLVIGQRDRTALGKGDVDPSVAKTLGNYPVLGRRAAEAIPGAKLVELDDVGHVPQVERFDAWIDALTSFLGQTGGG